MDLLSLLTGAGISGLGAWGLGKLREHRRRPRGLADLLGWAFLVGETTLLQKDGSFLTAWRYRGPDPTSASPKELDLLSRHMNQALGPLAEGWMLHIDAIRRPAAGYAPDGEFRADVFRLIDKERRQAYQQEGGHFETECYLTATYLPPQEIYHAFEKLLIKGGRRPEKGWQQVLRRFEEAAAAFEQRLAAFLQMKRLGAGALLTYLHECLTGLAHPVQVPPSGAYLNQVMADQLLSGGFAPKIGTFWVCPVAVRGLPAASRSGMMDFLGRLGLAFRWSTRFIPLGRSEAAREIRRARLNWFHKRKGASDLAGEVLSSGQGAAQHKELFYDQDADSMAADAAKALAENNSAEVRFGYYSSTLVLMNKNPAAAEQAAGEVIKAFQEHGITAATEQVNALEAFLGTLPGHGRPNLRRPMIHSGNLADLVPLTAPWAGSTTNPSPLMPKKAPALLWAETRGTTPFRLNIHTGDVGHTLVIGPTGAGKSVLVGLMAAQWMRYQGARAYIFDVGNSHRLLGLAGGGRHYEIAGENEKGVPLQPLRFIDEVEELAWAAGWLEVLLEGQGLELPPGRRMQMVRALRLLAENAPEDRTLTALMVNLGDEKLRAGLRPYTIEGAYGQLLDGNQDGIEEGGFQVFEIGALLDLPEKVLVPVLLHLFRRIEARLGDGPALIVIEEAWAALMKTTFANRIRQWLLTLRKQNAAVVLVAHSPMQFQSGELQNARLLTQSCPTRIFLPSPDAAKPEMKDSYAALGLSAAQVQIIAQARPKRDYYFHSPEGSRLFQLGLGPVALAFLAGEKGTGQAAREVKRLQQQFGPRWPEQWLRRCGAHRWADQLSADPATTNIMRGANYEKRPGKG